MEWLKSKRDITLEHSHQSPQISSQINTKNTTFSNLAIFLFIYLFTHTSASILYHCFN